MTVWAFLNSFLWSFQKNIEELLLEILDRQDRLEKKIDRLFTLESTNISEDDINKDLHIKFMASSRELIRSKTNYKLCLSALGLPIMTTLEDVSTITSD